jgi:signal transduction histidine kinase
VLDEHLHVLNVNKSLAGSEFSGLTGNTDVMLHEQLHPGCSGGCRFLDLWDKAWTCLKSRDSIEWELDDTRLKKLLRLNLTKPATSLGVETDRRRRHAVLTITDITSHRREYRTLVDRERALAKLLITRGINVDDISSADDIETQTREILVVADYGKQYRTLSRQVIEAQELERRRIATELHDGIAQSLGVMKYGVEAAAEKLSGAQHKQTLEFMNRLVIQVVRLMDDVRRISNNLVPSVLDDFGLGVAVNWLCSEFNLNDGHTRVTQELCIDESSLADSVKIAAFRVIQEALNNVAKHAAASEAKVRLRMIDGALELEVIDNGVGFDQEVTEELDEKVLRHLGMHSMRDRVLVTGGDFSVNSKPGEGTSISARWSPAELKLMRDESVLDSVYGDS